jgi:predicted HTH transcriptional regulator
MIVSRGRRQSYGAATTSRTVIYAARFSMQLLELCRERGRITVAEATKATGADRNTIKDYLKAPTRAGHIAQHGAGRGAWCGLA